jgi:S-adenosylmethionine-dependent methyltransferase
MAERGARVHGIDIDAKLLSIAEMRSRFHNLPNVSFEVMNATEIDRMQPDFDLIIFFATLEHMTHTERLSALRSAWRMLPLGGFLAVVEAPNRLWYYDNHTTLMNYYQWLPDDVAIDYAKFVSRDAFRESMEAKMPREEKIVSLARWGRGASYHEIEIAIGPVDQLNVRDGMDDFRRRQQPDLDDYWERSSDAIYRNAIRAVEPRLQSAFFYPWLNVLIQK